MLFKQATLSKIAAGEVLVAYRRWRRPSVKPGGTLQTSVGLLAIASVEPTTLNSIDERAAWLAGYESKQELLAELNQRTEGKLYRIRFTVAGPDPRIALREHARLSAEEIERLATRLARLDKSSRHGPWTKRVLQAIATHPATKAGELAERLGLPKERLKLDVRKLKALGLTESLLPGYRLSPRGKMLLKRLL